MRDFNLILKGFYRREEREWNRTRHILSFQKAFAGMGGGEYTPPSELYPLEMDEEDVLLPITNMKQAIELIKEFMAD